MSPQTPENPDSSEELAQIRAAVVDVLDEQAPLRRTHEVMVADGGFDPRLQELLIEELGLLGLTVPESLGGLELDAAAATTVVGELGARLVPGVLSHTLMGILAISRFGPSADPFLQRVVNENLTLTTAFAEEGVGWSVAGTQTTAAALGDGIVRLLGTKVFVPATRAARALLVTARDESGAVGVFAVDLAGEGDASQPDGVRISESMTLDQTRRLSTVVFDGARASRLDEPGADGAAAQALLDHERALIALESAAAAVACLDLTVEYLKVREQFGRPIGQFQALKHRCADLAVAVAGARATADHLVSSLRENGATRSYDAALAKLVCADALMAVAADAIQLHGGIGFTFEHDAHLFFKRGKAAQLTAGTPAQLRDEVAALAAL